MEDTKITFETAKLAKEKGFNGLCYDAFNSKGNLYSNGWCEYLYDNEVGTPFWSDVLMSQDILAPTQSLLAKWLREEYNLHINICSLSMNCFSFMLEKLNDTGTTLCGGHLGKINYKSYEEANEIGLQEALKLI